MRKFVSFIVAVGVVASLVLWQQPASAAPKTFTYTADKYSFTYPSTWSTKKFAKSVGLVPPSATLKSLATKGITYSANVQLLNNDSTVLTTALKTTLKKSWSGFASAYSKALAKKLGASVTVGAYTRSGWSASLLTFTKTVSGVKTTWRIVLLSPDKKSVYSVSEKWTKQSASPFTTTVAALVKSLTPFANVNWSFNGTKWVASGGTVPTCPSPFMVRLPVNIAQAYSVLYPGQVRGGQYKPHGGFRLDGHAYDSITITAPFDGYVVDGSRHYEGADIQYYFDFIHPCRIRYRLDHLNTLSPTMAKLADQLPAPTTGSQSYVVTPTFIPAGTVVATAVGHPDNVGFDLGVYDLRKTNEASQDAAYQVAHADMISNAFFAICWFDWLSATDEAAVRALPAADGVSGTTSDYCS
jgi:hypothetical protein